MYSTSLTQPKINDVSLSASQGLLCERTLIETQSADSLPACHRIDKKCSINTTHNHSIVVTEERTGVVRVVISMISPLMVLLTLERRTAAIMIAMGVLRRLLAKCINDLSICAQVSSVDHPRISNDLGQFS